MAQTSEEKSPLSYRDLRGRSIEAALVLHEATFEQILALTLELDVAIRALKDWNPQQSNTVLNCMQLEATELYELVVITMKEKRGEY